MRIAILTLPLHTNYGGILQAYALQTVLERMGHEVKVLSPPPYKPRPIWIMPLVYVKRASEKIFHNEDIPIFIPREDYSRKNTEQFISSHINRHTVSRWEELKGLFDVYIVGSDQIWRPKYADMFSGITNAFLEFASNWQITRIAYAPSFGTKEWEYSTEQTTICRNLIQLFDKVSVREDSGVELCNDKFGVIATHVVDPTMLLDLQEYTLLLENSETKPNKGQLMCYLLDKTNEKINLVSKLAEEKHMVFFDTLKEIDKSRVTGRDCIQPSVEQWLRSIKDADLIVTDSFHACVFSIIFQKQFYVIPNEMRGNSRIESLLKMFDLSDRIITTSEKLNDNQIDYSPIQRRLDSFKEYSMQFLKNIQAR